MKTTMQRCDPRMTERASKADKTWFAGHPGKTVRIRRVVPGESGAIDPSKPYVRVEQLAPGIRRKVFLTGRFTDV